MKGITTFFASLRFAISGLVSVFQREQNFRIQIAFGFFVILVSWYLEISKAEWIVVLLLITAVLILEIINSAVEHVVDVVKPRLHWQVKLIKDMMAGAVLVVAISSAIIGITIFYPYIVEISLKW